MLRALPAQQLAEKPEGLALSFGGGFQTGKDLIDRNLSQEADAKSGQAKIGISAAISYRENRHWGATLIWNRGGSYYFKSGLLGSGNYKEKSTVFNCFSLLFERRFAIRADSYLYWGIGVGASYSTTEKVPYLSSSKVEKSSSLSIWPQWKPIGVCLGNERVKPYLELGLFSLPLVSAGLKVRIAS